MTVTHPTYATVALDPARALLPTDVVFPLADTERSVGVHAEDLGSHLARHGARPHAAGAGRDALLADLELIALTGRGGAHFPAAVKWRAAVEGGPGGTVVANGAEGEPASAKDAALLQCRPHLVLDGLMVAVESIGATDAVVWLHDHDLATRRAVLHAIEERTAHGLDPVPVRVVTTGRHYLSGEATGIVRSLDGGPALPRIERIPAARVGVRGRPTLVHNVETLARVAVLARDHASGYRDSTLITAIAENHRRVLELAPFTTFEEVAASAPGQPAPQAVLVGGYGGMWIPWAEAAALPLHEPSLRAAGYSLGAGVVAPLGPEGCGIAQTATLLEYLADSSARQCGPCLNGLPLLARTMRSLASGTGGRAAVRRLRQVVGEVEGRGACRHPDGATRLLSSALLAFADDVRAHARGRVCTGAARPPMLPVPEVVWT